MVLYPHSRVSETIAFTLLYSSVATLVSFFPENKGFSLQGYYYSTTRGRKEAEWIFQQGEPYKLNWTQWNLLCDGRQIAYFTTSYLKCATLKTRLKMSIRPFFRFGFAMNSNFCIIFRASFLQIILSITSASGQRIEHQRADGLERQLEG